MSDAAVDSIEARTPHLKSQESLQEWLQRIPEPYADAIQAVVSGLPLSGHLEGVFCVRGYDRAGRSLSGSLKYDDAQTIGETEADLAVGELRGAGGEGPPATEDCERVARDRQENTEHRADALRGWMQIDQHAASAFVVDELCRVDLPSDWRNTLVFAAEDGCFPTSVLQQQVCEALRRIALELRTSSQPGIDRVVWSALRRFASLIEPRSVDQLRDFLSPGGYVDTRLLALQSVVHVFERRPPEAAEPLTGLADRTFDIAKKLFDPDVFTSGETSAIATQAVLVLCVLGDHRALECVQLAKAMGRRWVIRKLRGQLEEIQCAWADEDASVQSHASYTLVQEVLSHLK